MKNKKVLWLKSILVVMCLLLFLVGCGTSKNMPQKKAGERQNKTEVTPGVEEKKNVKRGEVDEDKDEDEDEGNIPESLDNIEDDAEDMIKDISKGDWAKADERLSSIEKNWSIYEPIAKKSKVPQEQINTFNNDLNNLKKQVKNKKPHEASLAANKLRISSVDFMKLYKTKALVDLEKVELYNKQILLTAEHGDWKRAGAELKTAVDIWNSIKTEADKINTTRTKKISDTLTEMSDAVKKEDIGKVKELYKKLDDEIDILKDDFRI